MENLESISLSNQTKDLIDFQNDVFRIESTKGSSEFQARQYKGNKTPCQQSAISSQRVNIFEELMEFNKWNYTFSRRALMGISEDLSKHPFAKRAKSAPIHKKRREVEFHPKLNTMLRKWKSKFNQNKRKKGTTKKAFTINGVSGSKLRFIKKNKNDELSLLDMCPLIKRNICKDDLFLPRRSTFDENSNRLVITFCAKSLQPSKKSDIQDTSIGTNLLKSNVLENINNYHDYSVFFNKISKNKKYRTLQKKGKISKLLKLLSVCSRKKNSIEKMREPPSPPVEEPSMISKIIYEFGIQKTKEINLHLLRVKFKDNQGKLVML